MKKLSLTAAATLSLATVGCLGDRELTRDLSIHQAQSTLAYDGPFDVDASQLPPGAVTIHQEEDYWGDPQTSLEIDSRYSVRLVLVPSTRPARSSENQGDAVPPSAVLHGN